MISIQKKALTIITFMGRNNVLCLSHIFGLYFDTSY
jgi:hypothetical protein